MLKEFKEFVNQGNAIDLAVGILIGAAFGKIVNSLVTDVITPLLSPIMGGTDFKHLYIPMKGQALGMGLEEARKQGAVIAYGMFLNTVIEFLIVAFSIFLIVRQINRWRGPAKPA
jgi:large conductance mechanosensitive channel